MREASSYCHIMNISSINRFQIRGIFPSGAVERIFCSITDIKCLQSFGQKEYPWQCHVSLDMAVH